MKKFIFFFIAVISLFPQLSTAFKIENDSTEESLLDKLQEIVEVRRSFNVPAQTKKPALMSLRKNYDEPVTYSIDIAVSYIRFKYQRSGIIPSIQFDYSSNSKDRIEQVTGGIDFYYIIYKYSGGSGKIEPFLTVDREFYAKITEVNLNISFVPSFPKFFIPVQDISNYKFKYNGKDNRWVLGFTPSIGATYQRSYAENKKSDNTDFFSLVTAGLTVRRYYLQFDLFGQYEKGFTAGDYMEYNYEANMTFYFDSKERSSLNARFIQRETNTTWNRNITIGFGLML